MTKLEPKQRTKMDTEEKLEYLDFVQVVAIYVVENSGPLKPGVRTVEDTVRTVIGPVYDKFHDVPFQLLKFVDHKVLILWPLLPTGLFWLACFYPK
ncbi:stress-related protein [Salix suchowensis]|nr:stress-related protein [Salix suchowensis]